MQINTNVFKYLKSVVPITQIGQKQKRKKSNDPAFIIKASSILIADVDTESNLEIINLADYSKIDILV